ncbi:hypothetical protein Q7C36_005107 [Tachysurus vachellii]|uniref:RGS domain-containing protein n=1 Tax=Tachysurus vachellii TaxID=175792 RepID=A0AA88T3E3_TACVA|nr:hypothetical protein Q7C36_005107 [Tachysurus vachellii]
MGAQWLSGSTFASHLQGWAFDSHLRLVCVEFACSPRASGVCSGYSGFLPRSKDMHGRLRTEDTLKWKVSFQNLLFHKDGLCAFRAFLMSEHSEENIAFYLACEDYKNTKTSSKLCSKAKKIYEEFIDSDAPKEVNLDHETKSIMKKNMEHPTASCFDLAQSKIYTLMEKDCYPRFLKSTLYMELSRQAKP